ncbi:alanine/glycine:cation symporter family protein [Butyrivibrio sp. AE2032]|uniref:alanine/glycine:cation symporter family protein n=1 Tax=Butyrivibrio sp. AE2032 TaxID=1458463 RepID=UPI0005584EA2|nr:alanine/glycine:cation symporter family protein [Butyrivibrio sp. AE2032]
MEQFLEKITEINDAVNSFVWVKIGLVLLIGTGILLTFATKFFQISHLRHWWKKTGGGVFDKSSHNKREKGSVSQFQALCTALAATIGTGNIAGVSAAICIGGPGAVFWMWIAAFFGMMTNFSENVLGIYYRRKNEDGEWSGGAMYYLQDGLGSYKGCKYIGKILAFLFSCFTVLASFGIGNMGQVNKITLNIESAFFSDISNDILIAGKIKLVPFLIGIVLMAVAAIVILGGLKRIAAVAEMVVPFMAVAYIVGALILVIIHIPSIPAAFASIFKFAFGIKPVAGAAAGIVLKEVITQGCKRGVFSNEAGLGSSVMVHSNSDVKEPVKQGMWGIFEVFADTFVVCTMTALVVLTSGFINLETGLVNEGVEDATLVAKAFSNVFGRGGEWFIAVAILLFAFTTVLGWSHYGSKAVEYLIGIKAAKVYKVIFVLLIVAGAVMESSLAWDLSDTFNGLMMIPNLIGVIALFPLVKKITSNYVARKIKGQKDVKPLLSYDEKLQKEHEELVENGAE